MSTRFLQDAVLFDLDGTLVATDRFWVAAARAGCSKAFAELGLERPIPSAEEWLFLVGGELSAGIRSLFPDLDSAATDLITRRCVEQEESALRAGGAALYPGVCEVLSVLKASGVKLGIASNCSQSYLDHMLKDLGLERWVDEARCLDSPGISSKSDMLADLLCKFETRSAVMVGDRASDWRASVDNGLPHVHLTGGFATPLEEVPAEASCPDISALPALLDRRAQALDQLLTDLGAQPSGPPLTMGIGGGCLAGKTLLGQDLVARLKARGRNAATLELARFEPSIPAKGDGSPSAADPFAELDLALLLGEILRPGARRRGCELDAPDGGPRIQLEAGQDLILMGTPLIDPRLATHLDRLVHLEVSEDLRMARLLARDVPVEGPQALRRARSETLPEERRLFERYPPGERADLVVDGENPLYLTPSSRGPT